MEIRRLVKSDSDVRTASIFIRRYRDNQPLAAIASELNLSNCIVKREIRYSHRVIRLQWEHRQNELLKKGSFHSPEESLLRSQESAQADEEKLA